MITALGPRRLPVAVPPVGGESLRSLIEEAARAHHVPVPVLTGLAGANTREQAGHLLTRLDDDPGGLGPAVAALLGLTADGVNAMTVRGTADPAVTGWTDKGRAVHLGWGTVAAGRHCGRCLGANGGRWLLAWRSPGQLVCPRHDVLLTVSCHRCRQAPRGATTASASQVMPHGSRCAAPLQAPRGGHLPALCRADLTVNASVAHAGACASLGQAFVTELRRMPPGTLRTTPAGDLAPAEDHLHDLRLLARHMHATVQPGSYDLTGAEADTLQAWSAHRDRTSNAVPMFANPRHSTAYQLPHIESAAYAIAVGLAAFVISAADMSTARERLRPGVSSANKLLDRGWRYAVKRVWQSENIALWLLDALGQNQQT